MKVILKEDIKGVGKKYETKDVADGYANNFLIPRKLAEYATAEAIKRAEGLRTAIAMEKQIQENLAEKQIAALQNVKIVLRKKGNEKGHLFEKIHPEEISLALKEQAKIEIDSAYLKVEKPIKEVGEHKVEAEVGGNKGEFSVVVEIE
jgi:large subunit ribosomal protein L9